MLKEMPSNERMNETAEILNGVITLELVYNTLSRLQAPAPSTTVLYTRTPILQQLAIEAGVPSGDFSVRFLGTRSPAVLLNIQQPLWFDAHADTISYLFPKPTNELSSPLQQNCAHRPTVAREFPATVLRWNKALQGYERISEGIIGSTGSSEKGFKPYYKGSVKPEDGFKPSDRVVYTPTLTVKDGYVIGNMDNAAGLAVCLASLNGLNSVAKQRGMSLTDFGVGYVFPDFEEGLESDPAYWARGARAMIHRAGFAGVLPQRVVNVDGHDTQDPQPVVRYAAFVSGNKGPVVPPDVYGEFEEFLESLEPYGVIPRMTEQGAAVSRSDDAAHMELIEETISVGYDVRHPHFNDGPPTANLDGLVHTAKAVAYIAAEMGK